MIVLNRANGEVADIEDHILGKDGSVKWLHRDRLDEVCNGHNDVLGVFVRHTRLSMLNVLVGFVDDSKFSDNRHAEGYEAVLVKNGKRQSLGFRADKDAAVDAVLFWGVKECR